MLSANIFALPQYLVLGQQKSGTSTLWALMSTHPQLMNGTTGGGKKEPVYFQSHTVYNPNSSAYGMFQEHCGRYDAWTELCMPTCWVSVLAHFCRHRRMACTAAAWDAHLRQSTRPCANRFWSATTLLPPGKNSSALLRGA